MGDISQLALSENMRKWNAIVNSFNRDRREPETTIQEHWLQIVREFFGYSSLLGEIDAKRTIQIGSRQRVIPDLILRDATTRGDLFIIELKQHTIAVNPLGVNGLHQLYSYLRQLKLNIGILVCDKIYICNYEYGKDDAEQTTIEIEFERNAVNGEKFVDLFSKGNFIPTKIVDYIESLAKCKNNIRKIEQELTPNFLQTLVKNHYTKQYDEDTVGQALVKFIIDIRRKPTSAPLIPPNTPSPNTDATSTHKYIGYQFNGKIYGASRVVLSVLQQFVKDNPNATISELRSAFPKALQGSLGVVSEFQEMQYWNTDRQHRFFTKPNEILHTTVGEFIVCTQWGAKKNNRPGNIERFIEHARQQGYDITPIK
jgi:hypothetical protein